VRLGKTIEQWEVAAQQTKTTMNIKSILPGSYVLTVRNNGKTQSFPFIKL
jgi:hypothetical protein